MKNLKISKITLNFVLKEAFAYQPKIKFLGPRHLLQQTVSSTNR